MMNQIREVVETKSCKEIVCAVTGDEILVDLFTASAIIQVYDGLNCVNKIAYSRLSLLQIQEFAMRCCK